jgi:hypothetical protein
MKLPDIDTPGGRLWHLLNTHIQLACVFASNRTVGQISCTSTMRSSSFDEGELTTEFKRVVVGLSIIFVLSFLASLGCTIATIYILLRKDAPPPSSQADRVNLYFFSQPASSINRLLVYVMSRGPLQRLLHFGQLRWVVFGCCFPFSTSPMTFRWVLNLQCCPLQYITLFPAHGALEILCRGSCTAGACCSFS